MEMVCQLPCLSILQTPWGHDLDENSLQASSIVKPPCGGASNAASLPVVVHK